MTPSFRSISLATPATGTQLTFSAPAGAVVGDLLIASVGAASMVSTLSSRAWSMTGWTSIATNVRYSDEVEKAIVSGLFVKLVGDSEPTTYDAVFSTSAPLSGSVLCIADARLLLAANTHAGESATASQMDPPSSGTVDAGDYLAVALVHGISESYSPIAGYTQQANINRHAAYTRSLTNVTGEDPPTVGWGNQSSSLWTAWTLLVSAPPGGVLTADAVVRGLIYARPIADVATTGWSTAPLYSKVDDDPDAPDGTVVSASV